jgi:very-short-patch-repair endonuclease
MPARLVVEIDGDTHTEETDERKTKCLQEHGYQVLRIPVGDVDESMDDVMDAIFFALGADPT